MTRRPPIVATLAVLAVAAVPVVAQAAKGSGAKRYSGRTAQRITVSLSAPRKGVRTFRYRATLSCSDGSRFLDAYFSDDVLIRRNRFSSRFSSSRGAVKTTVTGKLTRRRATGTIRIVERYSSTPDASGHTPLSASGTTVCDSGKVRWSATARR